MQQPDQTSDLTPNKLDLSAIQLKLHRFDALASLAISTYQKASVEQRCEWANRFWNKPTTLKDQCLQQLAMKVLETGKHLEKNDDINDDLVSALNEKLVEAYDVMTTMHIRSLMDFKVHEELHLVPTQIAYQNVNVNNLRYFPEADNSMSAIIAKHLGGNFDQNIKFNNYHFKPSAKPSSPPDVIIPGKEEYEGDERNVQKYANYLRELGSNPASFFHRLPKELLVDVASRMRNSSYMPEEKAKTIAAQSISNQNAKSIVIRHP